MLCNLLIITQAVMRFTLVADASDDVPNLHNKTYGQFQLSRLEWEQLKLMREVLQVCYYINRADR
jgi:hypothetical protein